MKNDNNSNKYKNANPKSNGYDRFDKNNKPNSSERNNKSGGSDNSGKSNGYDRNFKSGSSDNSGKSNGYDRNFKSGGSDNSGKSNGYNRNFKSGGSDNSSKSNGYDRNFKSGGSDNSGKSNGYDRNDKFNKQDRFEKKSKPFNNDKPYSNKSNFEKPNKPIENTYSEPEDETEDTKDGLQNNVIVGRNPVMEALKSGAEIENIYIAQGERNGSIVAILSVAKEKGIVIKEVSPQKLNYMSDSKNHQGVAAMISSAKYIELDEIIASCEKDKGLIIICDEIEDPHNLGAIIRTAEACGANGIVIPKRRSAPITASCYKASAGACSYMKIAKVSNLNAAIDKLKQANFWVYAAEAGGENYTNANYKDRNVALVIGSEGHGVGRLIKEKCDYLVSMPMLGNINSLNASVAAGILMYEIVRQKLIKK